MANEEHLAILKQGGEIWNQWRLKHRGVRPNLSAANLIRADLMKADLSGVRLCGADLRWANLNGADLSGADLRSTGTLRGASLRGASLLGANLRGTILQGADLSGADLSKAVMWFTVLESLDLRQVKGLETVEHWGASGIDIQTIYRSQGEIPEVFLRGAGVPDSFIEYMRSLVGRPIDYYSAFISYSSKDEEFARRLYNDLQGEGVRCWFAPEELKTGDKFWERIDEGIRVYD